MYDRVCGGDDAAGNALAMGQIAPMKFVRISFGEYSILEGFFSPP
jgi:hypothetical protein